MILVNTDFISGKQLDTLGIVKGTTVQSKHLGSDIMASFKTIVGGAAGGVHRDAEQCPCPGNKTDGS